MKTIDVRTLTVLGFLATASAQAQVITTLHSFTNGFDGENPSGTMILSGNTIYGTSNGGTNGGGVIFSIGLDGSNFTPVYTFSKFSPATNYNNLDGAAPVNQLLLSGGTLFGSAAYGGSNSAGTLFSVGTNGSNFNLLHTFAAGQEVTLFLGHLPVLTNADGGRSAGGMVLAGDTLFGAAQSGGANGGGTLFSVRTNGSNFTLLHTFAPGNYLSFGSVVFSNADGYSPNSDLLLNSNVIYGTTVSGGTNGFGAIFSMDTTGSNFTLLHTFSKGIGSVAGNSYTNTDGTYPNAGLVLSGSTLFGITTGGGSKGGGTVFAMQMDGSAFRVIRAFSVSESAREPFGKLALSGNLLYGRTRYAGDIFSLDTNGFNFRILYQSFLGFLPIYTDGLIVSGDVLYEASYYNQGYSGYGSIFSLTIPSVVAGITANPNASMSLNFAGAPNYTYRVQSTTNLTPPSTWQTISTNTAAADGTWQVIDTNASSIPAQFYRAVTP